MSFADAVELDRRNEYIKAADAYEAVIAAPGSTLDAFVNLAGLYWQATDPGAPRLGHDFFLRAARRCLEVLDEAEQRFGPLPQVLFWRRYIQYISLGGSEFDAEALQWLRDCSFIHIYLYPRPLDPQVTPGMRQALLAARDLPAMRRALAEAKANPTILNQYVASILEGAIEDADACAAA